MKRCNICQSKGETKYISLFYNGSEGLDVCHTCEMVLVETVRGMVRVASVSRTTLMKDMKELRDKVDN